MIRSGVDERVAMTISGHRSRAVFDKYDITDDTDQREALRATMKRTRSLRKAVGGEVVPFRRRG